MATVAVPVPVPAFPWWPHLLWWWRRARHALVGFVLFLLAGNGAILAASYAARATVDTEAVAGVDGVPKLRAVDAAVLRGANPTREGYRDLAAAGVTVSVDLRAEDGAAADDAYIERLGVRVVHLPIRDGQLPGADDVQRFLEVVRRSDGRVFVHCGAGIGRTGAMVAAYLHASGQGGIGEALARNLAVGPPSLEQIVYAAGGADRPSPVVVGISRVLDAPRRIWHLL